MLPSSHRATSVAESRPADSARVPLACQVSRRHFSSAGSPPSSSRRIPAPRQERERLPPSALVPDEPEFAILEDIGNLISAHLPSRSESPHLRIPRYPFSDSYIQGGNSFCSRIALQRRHTGVGTWQSRRCVSPLDPRHPLSRNLRRIPVEKKLLHTRRGGVDVLTWAQSLTYHHTRLRPYERPPLLGT